MGAVSKITLSQLSHLKASVLLQRVPKRLPNLGHELARSHWLRQTGAADRALGGPSRSFWQHAL